MKEKVFVLVHPAWHGAWCWKKVAPLLQKGGHSVFSPTLTGLGERSHLARAEIGLEVHVSDILNVLKYEDLRDVVLVGHSSAGAVITGVADRTPEQIAHVVYLDAFVPENGQAVLDLVVPERRQAMEALVKTEGKGWLLPRFAPPPWETQFPRSQPTPQIDATRARHAFRNEVSAPSAQLSLNRPPNQV